MVEGAPLQRQRGPQRGPRMGSDGTPYAHRVPLPHRGVDRQESGHAAHELGAQQRRRMAGDVQDVHFALRQSACDEVPPAQALHEMPARYVEIEVATTEARQRPRQRPRREGRRPIR